MQHCSLVADTAYRQPVGLPEFKLFDTYYSRNALWQTEEVAYARQGMAGDPLPHRFRNDDLITGALLLSFFLIAWILTSSRRYITASAKNFFYPRERDNMFAGEGDSELRGAPLFVVLVSFLLGILFIDYARDFLPEVCAQISPYKLLAVAVGVIAAFFVGKTALYKAVNSIFFERWKCEQWRQDYRMSILTMTVLLLPLVSLVVFFDLDYALMRPTFLAVLLAVETLLLYRCRRIFFDTPGGYVHLFLYFCTLEMAPLLILWRTLLITNYYLINIY